MQPFTLVTPGKLVLLGEYAVLDGAPAIVAAVDRGVQVHVQPSSTRSHSVPGPDDRFVAAALANAPAAHYAFTDHHPVTLAGKPGFGGSAAATVAAVRAARHVAGLPSDPAAEQAEAFAVHHAVQGSGSGIDVAASTYGGVLRFQHQAAAPLAVRPTLEVVYSGQSAATGPRVQRYLAQPPAMRAAFSRALTACTDAFQQDPLGQTREAWRTLCAMAASAQLDYRTPAIDRIVALAEAHGGAAKPSGAGGGDVVVALFADPDARVAFRHAVTAAGWPVIPVQIAERNAPQPA